MIQKTDGQNNFFGSFSKIYSNLCWNYFVLTQWKRLFFLTQQEKDEEERRLAQERKSTPHLYNLNPDPMLTGMIVHLLKQGTQFLFQTA